MAVAERKKRRRKSKAKEVALPHYVARRRIILALMAVAFVAALARAVDQQIFETDFLQAEGQRRFLREVEMPAHRGMIYDRLGVPLAISTPVDSIWANPRKLTADSRELAPLAELLEVDLDSLRRKLAGRSNRGFVYLKRRVSPDVAEAVMALGLPAVSLQREYRRFYPSGEITAHLLGFTDVDDQGQEGLELAYNDWLDGATGSKLVLKDALSRIVKDVERIREAQPGKDLYLSIDRRIQYLAYRELKAAVLEHKAKSASAVVLDARTGEILAMVNQPAYNPNGSRSNKGGRLRNRAYTDVFEPGSTIKPFTVAAALQSGQYTPDTEIETSPGYMRIGKYTIRDTHNYGLIDVSTVISKSSNIGASKIALSLPMDDLSGLLWRAGFGQPTEASFPGEAAGQLPELQRWSKVDLAALSYGYGLSVTPVQLAQAYTVFAGDGVLRSATMLKQDKVPEGKQVLSPEIARAVRTMMEAVVSTEGTAVRASIPGYRVAGKTGTIHKSQAGGYSSDRYVSVFAGVAPASDPRLVMVVVVNEPRAGKYYGGLVAAPIFSKVIGGALRLLNIAPDDLDSPQLKMASLEDAT